MTDKDISLVRQEVMRSAEAAAKAYADGSLPENTERAYRSDLRSFAQWCNLARLPYLPAEPKTLAMYIAALADTGRKVSTIGRAMAAISMAHQAFRHPTPTDDPEVKRVWKGIRLKLGVAKKKKSPISPQTLGVAFDVMPTTLTGIRDRALLMLGFAGGFRRSELVGLNVADLDFVEEGLKVHIGRSKTDVEGEGRTIGIHRGVKASTCPVRLVRKWLELSGLSEGPLFRGIDRLGRVRPKALHPSTVADIVKAAARAAGADEKAFAGHSLRAGLVTAAARANKPTHAIMAQTGHELVQTLHGYIREANLFRGNVTKGLY